MKKYCLEHGGYDSDGDGVCNVFECADDQIKEVMDPCELVYTACPHCQSEEGFRMTYEIQGHGYEERDYKNGVIDADKIETHNVDDYVVCLSCGEQFSTEQVRTD